MVEFCNTFRLKGYNRQRGDFSFVDDTCGQMLRGDLKEVFIPLLIGDVETILALPLRAELNGQENLSNCSSVDSGSHRFIKRPARSHP